MSWTNDESVNHTLAAAAVMATGKGNPHTATVDSDLFKTVRIQLIALGLIEVRPMTTVSNTTALFWGITAGGREVLLRIRTVKAATASPT